ncbi:MAG: hypothetical protein R6U67_07610 [Sodalinema sp.]
MAETIVSRSPPRRSPQLPSRLGLNPALPHLDKSESCLPKRPRSRYTE